MQIVEDIDGGHYYAMKTFAPPKRAISAEAVKEEFVNEIALWLELPPHENIVRAHFVEIIDGQPCLFLEYVHSGAFRSLRDWIGNLPFPKALDFAYQVCLGMECANRATQVIHLDLKPDNVLTSSEGVAKVTDFGVSRRFRPASGQLPRVSAGSLPYESPEQLRGEVVGDRSDIFSFGVMFYEMLTGKLPYPFDTGNLISDDWRRLLPQFYDSIDFYGDDPSKHWCDIDSDSVPSDASEIVFGCLMPYPGRRYWRDFRGLRLAFDSRFPVLKRDQKAPVDAHTGLHSRALALHRVGRLDEALAVFNRALTEAPMNAALWRDAALALIDAHQRGSAELFRLRAMEFDPSIDLTDSRFAELSTSRRGM